MIWWLALLAWGAEQRQVRPGETVESIAAELGGGRAANQIRSLNGLRGDEQPAPGDVLELPAPRQRDVDQPALLSALTGYTSATIGTAPPAPLEIGDTVPTGSELCTGPASFATIRLAFDPDSLRHDDALLDPESCVRLRSAAGGGGTRASVLHATRGTVSIRTSSSHPGAVTVLTDAGSTRGDRGGFRVTVETDAARTEAVYERVVVLGAREEVVVEAGYGTRVRPDQPPDAPTPLLLPGTPVVPEAGHPLRRAAFTWTPVERALAYRVELSPREDFGELLVAEQVPDPSWRPEVLFLPFRVPGLWWRVASVDRTGFVGIPSEGRALAFPAEVGP